MDGRKRYRQILAFVCGPCLEVLHLYFDTKVLSNITFKNFFDDVNLKHVLFHEYIPTIPCCECCKQSLAASSKHGNLGRNQFHVIYEDKGMIPATHEKKKKKVISQYCLCKFSTKSTADVSHLDIILMSTIICRCCSTLPGNPNWLRSIKETRNFLMHKGDGQLETADYQARWAILEAATLGYASTIGSSCEKLFKRQIEELTCKSIDELTKMIKDSSDDMHEINNVLNGMVPLQASMSKTLDEVSAEQKLQSKQINSQGQDIKEMKSMIETMMYTKFGGLQTLSEVRRHNEEQPTTSFHEPCDDGVKRHKVLLTIATPSSWDKTQIEENLNARLTKKREVTSDELELVDFEFKCLILTTAAPESLINNKTALMTAIGSFLEGIFKDCGIDTTIPETVFIVVDVYCPLPSDKLEVNVEEKLQNTELKTEMKRLPSEFDRSIHIKDDIPEMGSLERPYDEDHKELQSSTEPDLSDLTVVCNHCSRTFLCKGCLMRNEVINKFDTIIKKELIEKFVAALQKGIVHMQKENKEPIPLSKTRIEMTENKEQIPLSKTRTERTTIENKQPIQLSKTTIDRTIIGSFTTQVVSAYREADLSTSQRIDFKTDRFQDARLKYERMNRKDLYIEIMKNATLAILRIIEFIKMIPGFQELCNHDQILLLKNGVFQVSVVLCSNFFDLRNNSVMFGSTMVPLSTFNVLDDDEQIFRDEIFHLMKNICILKLTEAEMALFCSFLIFQTEFIPNIKDRTLIMTTTNKIIAALHTEIEKSQRYQDLFSKLKNLDETLRKMSAKLTNLLNKLQITIPNLEIHPLIRELFNLSNM